MSTYIFDVDDVVGRIMEAKCFRTERELGEWLGFKNRSAFSQRKTRDSFPVEKLELECLKAGINFEWVMTGRGDKHSEDLQEVATGEACLTVDIFNMVSGGDGAVPEWHEPIDRRAIPTRYLKTGVRPVLVRGRSMEPTFKNGAIIGVNENDKQVIEGEAYAVMLPYSGAAVKRLYLLPDGILLRSDNKEFPEAKLKKDEIPDHFILGRVCWVVQEV